MYVVIRKFSAMRSVPEAARRAESGIGQILKQSPGFVAYYVFDGARASAAQSPCSRIAARRTPRTRRRSRGFGEASSISSKGDPEIIAGEVLAEVLA
jgi:hypothetical protein